MRKNSLLVVLLFLVSANLCFAQKPVTNDENSTGSSGGSRDKAFKPSIPDKDKLDVIDVTGIGDVIYTASNTADGSTGSYYHSLKITIGLLTSKNRTGNCQLVFTSADISNPYSVTLENDVVNIFYPMSAYEGIRTKLEQSLAARKKVQIKVTQKTNGYREGTLIL